MRNLITTAFCALLLAAAVPLQPAWSAGHYPDHTVKFIVPFGAGGPADVFARDLAQHLSDSMKGSFIVEDRPGAGSVIGTEAVHQSKPDGYTLLLMSNTHTTNETLMPNKPFKLMRDFVPVAAVNYSDLLLVVHPSVKAKSVKELIALAKAEPGVLNYASSGPGTPYHMAAELFKSMTGINIVHVPHKTSGQARNDVLGGHVQMMFDAITTMLPNAKAGRVRALATTGDKRSPITPDIPTVAQAGVPGYSATIWLGIMAPKGTPPEIVKTLNTEINKVINLPEVKARWEKQGAVPMTMTPQQFDAYLRKDIVKWGNVVKSAHITIH